MEIRRLISTMGILIPVRSTGGFSISTRLHLYTKMYPWLIIYMLNSRVASHIMEHSLSSNTWESAAPCTSGRIFTGIFTSENLVVTCGKIALQVGAIIRQGKWQQRLGKGPAALRRGSRDRNRTHFFFIMAIKMTQHERHGVSNHPHINCLFNS